jgi:O-antigen/teichoic acid export membrane protein
VAVKFVVVVWLVALKASLAWFVLAELLSNIPGILIIAYRCLAYLRPSFRIDLTLWRFLFKESWPLALSTVLAMIYLRVDQILLFRIKGAAALGYYAPTVKITELFNLLPIALMATVFPLFAKYHADSQLSLKKAYDASAKYLLTLIIPVAGAVTLLADKIILLMYGSEFLPSAPALIILIWSEVFIFAGSVNNKLLISIGKQRVDFLFTGASAVLNVGLNLILIPRFSFAGAAMASLAAYALGPMLNCLYKPLRSYALSMLVLMLKPLAATIIMMAVMYAARKFTLVSAAAGVLTYLAAMLLIKGIDVQEIRMLLEKKIDMA